ncbi:MAG: hypothetical protein WDM88_12865 [Galbitalea sp.]
MLLQPDPKAVAVVMGPNATEDDAKALLKAETGYVTSDHVRASPVAGDSRNQTLVFFGADPGEGRPAEDHRALVGIPLDGCRVMTAVATGWMTPATTQPGTTQPATTQLATTASGTTAARLGVHPRPDIQFG